MTYPAAYCVKCKAHTETINKHSIVLSNKARAMRGQCPKCDSENYKILPAKKTKVDSHKSYQLATVHTLPTATVTRPLKRQTVWHELLAYSFFVMACFALGFVLVTRL